MVNEHIVSSEKTNKYGEIHQEELNFPKIRFPEFEKSWKEVQLKDIASFSKGKGISKNETSEKGIPCIRYGELYTKYNENITEIYSKTNLEIENLVLSEKNDILIPCSGETAIDLATASCVRDENVAIGGDITIIKTNQYAPFITYCLNNKRTEIAKYAQGVSIVHLYAKDFQKMKIKIPQISEQKKIVELLENLNKKIDSLEKKKNFYKDYKRYLVQNLTEYKGQETWKKYKIKELLKEYSEKSTINNQFPVLSSTKEGIKAQLEYFNRNIASSDNVGYKIIHRNQLVLSPQNLWLGNININDEYDVGLVSPSYKIYDLTDIIDINYLKNIIKTPKMLYLYKTVSEQGASVVRRNLNKELFENIEIFLPSKSEQEKIGFFLKNVDNKIEYINNNKLELELFKKGLLQKMFV